MAVRARSAPKENWQPAKGIRRDIKGRSPLAGYLLPARLRTPTGTLIAATAAATKTAGARRLRARLVDREIATAEGPLVQLGDGLLGIFLGCHLDEGEPACASRLAIANQIHRLDRATRCEEILKVGLTRFKGQIAYVQLPIHMSLHSPAGEEPWKQNQPEQDARAHEQEMRVSGGSNRFWAGSKGG
jgi:hypothetical protein